MKHCFLIFACAIFALPLSAQTKPLPTQNTLQDKIYVLSQSWAEIKYNFVNIDKVPFDMDSLYFETLDRVLKTENDIDFYREIRRFFAAFNDGHTQLVRTNYSTGDYIEDIPASIRAWDGRYYFTSVKKNAGLDQGLLGAEILSIDGTPTAEYVKANYFPEISESTEARRWRRAADLMQQGEPGTLFRGTARTPSGKRVDFSIPFNYWATQQDGDEWWSYPTVGKPRFGLNFEDNVAILHLRDFEENMLPVVDSLMKIVIHRKPAGLILDLRDGRGGTTEVAWQLQKYIGGTEFFRTFGSQTRVNEGYGRAQGNWRDEFEPFLLDRAYRNIPFETRYREEYLAPVECRTVILIGPDTFSACEDLLINLSEVPDRPLFIGEETGGSTGAPLVIYFPHGAYARICTLRPLFPYSGTPFVGKGIVPDIEIKSTFEDYRTGKDPVMERALSILKQP